MKRVLLALILTPTLLMGGCQSMGAVGSFIQAIPTAITLATKSVTNPVTKADEAQAEAAIQVAFVALNAWRDACIAGKAEANCGAHIRATQKYTRQLRPYLNQLRQFVDNNDQVNASVVYNQLTQLWINAKTTAGSFGVNIGGV